MTEFYKVIDGDYISGIGTNGNDSVTEITEAEYNAIMQKIQSKPTDPDGYQYKLRADNLEWELVELPAQEDSDEEASPEDYESALAEMGVDFND